MLAMPQLSVATTSGMRLGTSPVQSPVPLLDVGTLRAGGQVTMTGFSTSLTVTVKEQVTVLPASSLTKDSSAGATRSWHRGQQLVGDVGFGNFASFDITQSQELKNQGVKREQITSVKLTKLSIEVTSPANGQDLTFIDSLTFFVESPGVAKKEIAKGGPFTAGATKADLTLVDLELAPYAAAPSMTFTTAATGKRPSHPVQVLARAYGISED